MANYKPLGVPFDRTFRNDLNENFTTLDTVAEQAKVNSTKALADSTSALSTANQAKTASDSTQAQLDQVVIEGDSSVEAAQARVKADGTTFTTLKDRLNNSDAQLAENANLIVYITDKRFGADSTLLDNTTAIQSAIDFVYNRGGGIVGIPFSPTPFIFASLIVKTNVTLKGYGGTLKLKDNVCNNSSISYYPINNLNYNNVTYDGLIVDGNQSNNTLYTVADVITCVGLGSKVVNCIISNAPDSGIMFSGAEKGRCQNNRISNCRDLGIYINASATSVINEAVVSGNIIDQCVYGGIGLKRESNHIVVSENTITNCGNGITVEDFTSEGTGYPKNFQIINNSIKDIGYMYRGQPNLAEVGISVTKADNSIISNNKIFNCSGTLLNIGTVTNTTFDNNIMGGYPSNPITSGNKGINVTTITDVAITNNKVKDVSDYGVYLQNTTGGNVTGNNINVTGSKASLRVNASCSKTIIKDNILTSGAGGDTEIYAGNTCIIKDNIQSKQTAGSPQYYGYRTLSAGQPAPNVGTYTPFFAGEIIIYLLNNSWWIACSTTAGDWKQLTT